MAEHSKTWSKWKKEIIVIDPSRQGGQTSDVAAAQAGGRLAYSWPGSMSSLRRSYMIKPSLKSGLSGSIS
jgi:hypothetical protein